MLYEAEKENSELNYNSFKNRLILIGILITLLLVCIALVTGIFLTKKQNETGVTDMNMIKEPQIAKTYKESEEEGILRTYYEMTDGSWKCEDIIYKYRLELTGKLPGSHVELTYIVLTNNPDITFKNIVEYFQMLTSSVWVPEEEYKGREYLTVEIR